METALHVEGQKIGKTMFSVPWIGHLIDYKK